MSTDSVLDALRLDIRLTDAPHDRTLRPSMDDNYVNVAETVTRLDNHNGPLLRTPGHPSQANLGGETGPLASGLGRRHAFPCPVVGRRDRYSARPP